MSDPPKKWPAAAAAPSPTAKRKFGAYKGEFTVPDSFFDPLSEEELAAWENSEIEPQLSE